MTKNFPNIGLACNSKVRQKYIPSPELSRLEKFANFAWQEFNETSDWDNHPSYSKKSESQLIKFTSNLDALIVSHGSPLISKTIIDNCPNLKFIGELEGDRFSLRIDLESCFEKGINVVDTTHGSSYPVAEWALALSILGLRNAGEHFRELISGKTPFPMGKRNNDPGFQLGELWERKVGLIGCGHIGRRLLTFLKPFMTKNFVYDPYIEPEIADIFDFTQTSLEYILSNVEVIICLAPLTPKTKGMIGKKQLNLIKPGTVLVNVSRGGIFNSGELIQRLSKKDIIASLDVFDPEPIPEDSPIRKMENVFLSPHVAGVTRRAGLSFFSIMVDELDRFFSGHKTRYNLSHRTIQNRKGL